MLEGSVRLGHVSDVHFTRGGVWEPDSWAAGVERLNALDLDAVLVTGDFTDWGLKAEWDALAPLLDEIRAPIVACLGNHDARREGWRFYEETLGRSRYYHDRVKGIDFVVLDSSEPDLDDGEVGREQRAWMREELGTARFPVVVLHHHLVPIPNTGREMNICRDAGGVLKVLDDNQVPLVLGGHRHMPWAWRLNQTLIAHAGTFSSNKRQMSTSFNVVTVERDCIRVELHKFPVDEVTPVAEIPVPARWGGSGEDKVEQVHEAGL